jgi:hypothetical protein
LRVSISARNRASALYAFMSVDLAKKVAVQILEHLASLAPRYAPMARALIPFCRALYANHLNVRSRKALITLSKRSKVAILLWRVVLCAQSIDDLHFSRPFYSFLRRFRGLVIKFDASVQGIGFLVYERDEEGNETLVGGGAVSLEEMHFTQSDFQNVSEFIFVKMVAGR